MRYYKIIDGEKVYFTGNILYADDATIVSPTEETILSYGWIKEVPIIVEPTEEELLAMAKRAKIGEINEYDSSEDVNVFYLVGQPMWLDAQTRQTLRISIDSYRDMGYEQVTKWFNGQRFTFPTNAWTEMLNALEVYAAEALNVTEQHKAEVNALNNVEDIEAYDITAGYPEKLNLTTEWLRSR